MRRGLHMLREYLALWLGLFVFGSVALTWMLLAAPAYYLLPRSLGIRLGRLVVTLGFRLLLRVLSAVGGCRFDLEALDELRTAGPLIIAPYHPCRLDAVFVLSRLPNVACIVKAGLVDNPCFGAGARLAGYIRNDSLLNMALGAVEELRAGNHLLLFPEGTRTTRWPVNTFTPGISRIAARAQVPIQTVFIETTSATFTKGWPLLRRPVLPMHYRVRLGRRFEPPTDVKTSVMDLERYFADALREVPHFLRPVGATPDVHGRSS